MKKYIFVILSIISFTQAFAIDSTIITSLNKLGLQVIMGELTGAGSKVPLQSLAGFVLLDGILLKENCNIIFVKNSLDQDVASIVRVVSENKNIEAQEIEGIITKK